MGSLSQVIVERFCRKVAPNSAFDVGFTDSDYIGFLFSYAGTVSGIDFRYYDEYHPYIGMLQYPLQGNFRYLAEGRYHPDVVICTDYLAKCGVIYKSEPLAPFDEQQQLFRKMLDLAKKGVVVTVPTASLPEIPHVQPEGLIYDKYCLRNLLDILSDMRYDVDITYYKDNDVLSPQQAQALVYPSIATCAIEVIKARY